MTRVGTRVRWVATGVAFLAVVAVVPAVILSRHGGGQGSDRALTVGPGPDTPAPDPPPASPSAAGPSGAEAPTGTTPTSTAPNPSAPNASAPNPSAPIPSAAAPGGDVVLARQVLPRPATTPARTTYQEFLSVCAPLGRGRAVLAGATVPVVFLGAPPSGPGLSPPPGAVAGRSSCLTSTDASAYWAPQLTVAGRAVDPSSAEVYYKSPVRDYAAVQPFPAGLRLEAGTLVAVTAQGASGSWSCGAERGAALPATCPAGARLVVRLQSPGCWDGVRLDTADHRGHLTYPTADRCPGTHPVALPMIELKLIYPVPTGALAARLATGDGTSFAFGFVAGWRSGTLDRLVAACINRGERCGADGTAA